MILKYSLSTGVCFTNLCKLLKIINIIIGDRLLPDSRHLVDKVLNHNMQIEYHLICPKCESYIGQFEKKNKLIFKCGSCEENVNTREISNNDFFIIIDPTPVISAVIADNYEYYQNSVINRVYNENEITDVMDGKGYQDFINLIPEDHKKKYLTGIFNSDGSVKFTGSKNSLWPIYLLINELPIQERFKNTFLCGLWFGRKKPDMAIYTTQFVKKMNQILQIGIQSLINNITIKFRLYLIICCVDSVARAIIQLLKQFNGHYGCSWCLHPGVWIDGSIRYIILPYCPDLRSITQSIPYFKEIVKRGVEVRGFIGIPPIINLRHFDFIKGFVPDSLHCCCEGVSSQFLEYYLKGLTVDQINFLDNILLNIKAPSQIERLSRPITDKGHWTARDYENFTLYYSIPLLRMFVSSKKIKHWSLYVSSFYKLQSSSIKRSELNRINQDLRRFVYETEKLYSATALTYNVHQMIHLTESVYYWGPIWAHSTYCFETANKRIQDAIFSAKGVHEQIIRFSNFQISMNIIENVIEADMPEEVKEYCDEMTFRKTKKARKSLGVTYFGSSQVPDSYTMKKFNLPLNCLIYQRMVKNKCLFISGNKVNQRSSNAFAQLENNQFIHIKEFIVCNSLEEEDLTIYNLINVRKDPHCSHLYQITSISRDEYACFTKNIKKICVYYSLNEVELYISPVCNMLYY